MSDAWAGLIFACCMYVIGGCHGLVMAWSQPSRMRYWANLVDLNAERVNAVRAAYRLDQFEQRQPETKDAA